MSSPIQRQPLQDRANRSPALNRNGQNQERVNGIARAALTPRIQAPWPLRRALATFFSPPIPGTPVTPKPQHETGSQDGASNERD